MGFEAPVRAPQARLEPEWIDYNGHLNMAYYNVLFDRGSDHAFDLLGCGAAYREARDLSLYTAEIHVAYLRELRPDALVSVGFQLLEHDEKRLRIFQTLDHADGWTAATCEALYLHVDMSGPRVAPFPPDVMAGIEEMMEAHRVLPVPAAAGKGIALRAR